MAKVEYRKPINSLVEEKNKVQQEITTITDQINLLIEQTTSLRSEESSYRTSLEALPKSATHQPARNVFNQQLSEVRLKLQGISTNIEQLNKRKEVLQSKVTSLDTSIKELNR